jgi:hypothetical protein
MMSHYQYETVCKLGADMVVQLVGAGQHKMALTLAKFMMGLASQHSDPQTNEFALISELYAEVKHAATRKAKSNEVVRDCESGVVHRVSGVRSAGAESKRRGRKTRKRP